MCRTIKRLFKRIRKQKQGIEEQRLSSHRVVAAALRMTRQMAKQTAAITGSPLARGEG